MRRTHSTSLLSSYKFFSCVTRFMSRLFFNLFSFLTKPTLNVTTQFIGDFRRSPGENFNHIIDDVNLVSFFFAEIQISGFRDEKDCRVDYQRIRI